MPPWPWRAWRRHDRAIALKSALFRQEPLPDVQAIAPLVRRGDIDAVGPLASFDLLAFADGVDHLVTWLSRQRNFGAAARSRFRQGVDRWGFRGLGRIADVGAGYGRWAAFLAEENGEVLGFERNEKGVALARRLASHFALSNLRWIHGWPDFQSSISGKMPSPSILIS